MPTTSCCRTGLTVGQHDGQVLPYANINMFTSRATGAAALSI